MAKKRSEATVYVPVEDLDVEMSAEHRQTLRTAIRNLEMASLIIAPQKLLLEQSKGEIQMVLEAYDIQTVAGDTYGIGYVAATVRSTLNRDLLRLNGVSQATIDKSMKDSDVSATLRVVLL